MFCFAPPPSAVLDLQSKLSELRKTPPSAAAPRSSPPVAPVSVPLPPLPAQHSRSFSPSPEDPDPSFLRIPDPPLRNPALKTSHPPTSSFQSFLEGPDVDDDLPWEHTVTQIPDSILAQFRDEGDCFSVLSPVKPVVFGSARADSKVSECSTRASELSGRESVVSGRESVGSVAVGSGGRESWTGDVVPRGLSGVGSTSASSSYSLGPVARSSRNWLAIASAKNEPQSEPKPVLSGRESTVSIVGSEQPVGLPVKIIGEQEQFPVGVPIDPDRQPPNDPAPPPPTFVGKKLSRASFQQSLQRSGSSVSGPTVSGVSGDGRSDGPRSEGGRSSRTSGVSQLTRTSEVSSRSSRKSSIFSRLSVPKLFGWRSGSAQVLPADDGLEEIPDNFGGDDESAESVRGVAEEVVLAAA